MRYRRSESSGEEAAALPETPAIRLPPARSGMRPSASPAEQAQLSADGQRMHSASAYDAPMRETPEKDMGDEDEDLVEVVMSNHLDAATIARKQASAAAAVCRARVSSRAASEAEKLVDVKKNAVFAAMEDYAKDTYRSAHSAAEASHK